MQHFSVVLFLISIDPFLALLPLLVGVRTFSGPSFPVSLLPPHEHVTLREREQARSPGGFLRWQRDQDQDKDPGAKELRQKDQGLRNQDRGLRT